MDGPEISVIIPVYNAEKYLSRCIESVLTQTFINFELLLIDDGSLDSSGKICDKYALIDHRIKVFHKKNGGVSDARNFGILNAIGKWIIFIDSDDYFLCNAFELLLASAKAYHASISSGNYFIEKNNNRKKFNNNKFKRLIIFNYLEQYFQLYTLRAGSALYSSDIIKKNLFDINLMRYEDLKYICKIIYKNRIVVIPDSVMVYSLDKGYGLSSKLDDISKDYIFNMSFKGKKFGECLIQGHLLNQGYKLYPEHKELLNRIYYPYKKWRLMDKLICVLHIKKIFRLLMLC